MVKFWESYGRLKFRVLGGYGVWAEVEEDGRRRRSGEEREREIFTYFFFFFPRQG